MLHITYTLKYQRTHKKTWKIYPKIPIDMKHKYANLNIKYQCISQPDMVVFSDQGIEQQLLTMDLNKLSYFNQLCHRLWYSQGLHCLRSRVFLEMNPLHKLQHYQLGGL